MPLSRRSFVGSLGASSVAILGAEFLTARGHEALAAPHPTERGIVPAGTIRLSSNENPHGPARVALDAVTRMFMDANRYPETYQSELKSAIAAYHKVRTENVLLGCGSGETLRIAVEAFTSTERALVTAAPTFENPENFARTLGHAVRAIPVDRSFGLDLDAMASASKGAGMVFLCNPNNPTGSAHPAARVRQFIAAVHAATPDAVVLVDEAYFHFADIAGYGTLTADAIADPRIIVSRTFSKVYGLAGLRVGYALGHADTVKRLEPYRLGAGVGVLAAAAAMASLPLDAHVSEQVKLNREARAFTREALEKLGFQPLPSSTNFLMFDIKRDVLAFQQALKAQGVLIGRIFPPLLTHARISVGTMAEMQAAMPVVGKVLRSA